MPTKAKITAIIQNLITIVDSAHPFCSKWWCKGAILNILLPVSLNDKICTITDTVSNTKRPPIITNTNSCLDADAVTPITPPSDNEGTQAMTLGCTDSDATNFNPEATTDDGSCEGSSSSVSSAARAEVLNDPYVRWAIGLGVVGFLVNMVILKKDLSAE